MGRMVRYARLKVPAKQKLRRQLKRKTWQRCSPRRRLLQLLRQFLDQLVFNSDSAPSDVARVPSNDVQKSLAVVYRSCKREIWYVLPRRSYVVSLSGLDIRAV